mmetsp:Transcript_112055/g.327732  ORF Transcript_112055/g.327732 Transcript_112055/m.327732 type:complete len:302 (-) Transcript_112055:1653-2558(-)
MTSLPLISRSPDAAAFFCFASSCWEAVKRAWSLETAAAASPPFASLCLTAAIFRASAHAAVASFSTSAVFERASFKASDETFSSSSEEKIFATSVKAATFCSAVETLSTNSARRAPIFRSTVSCLNCESFFIVSSSRFMSSLRSSVTVFEISFAYFFASASFVLMETFARFTAFSEAAAAFSESLIAFADSSCGSTSRPFKNGISASWHLSISSSARPTCSVTWTIICCTVIPSCCRLSAAATVSSCLREALPRSFISFNSSLMAPSAPRSFCSMFRRAAWMPCCAGLIISSAALISSSDI